MTDNSLKIDRRVVTTQRTSKVLKAQLALSLFMMLFGGFSWFLPYGGALDGTDGLSWSATAVIVGAVWYVVTKLMIWWEHG